MTNYRVTWTDTDGTVLYDNPNLDDRTVWVALAHLTGQDASDFAGKARWQVADKLADEGVAIRVLWSEQDHQNFLDHYVSCLLWSETVEDPESEPDEYGERELRPADELFGPDDIEAAGLDEIKADCRGFLDTYGVAIATIPGEDPVGDAAHNFCLSRNGHGTGFWDRGYGELGDHLHKAAQHFGTQGLSSAADGTLYVHS